MKAEYSFHAAQFFTATSYEWQPDESKSIFEIKDNFINTINSFHGGYIPDKGQQLSI